MALDVLAMAHLLPGRGALALGLGVEELELLRLVLDVAELHAEAEDLLQISSKFHQNFIKNLSN